ncbi:MAG TPA: MBL fold metallo-hydrolase [Pyrinomonadaceae bacterium]|nr:MBL fold metallo-hydrolase [Pyrinomonadaceae bacterium]
MYFKQFYLNCLAHASYLIGSEGEAAVVDPQRDVDQYLDEAAAQDLKIKYVIETHLHADFVSGHRELAARSGAQIIFGEQAQATIPHRPVANGEELVIGRVKLRFLETPGHTPEGICVLVSDTEVSDQPQKVLTGDTLFIGDVGRPDLAGSEGYTPQMMAGMMYDSLHEKLLRLDDAVEVFPAHGAGSMCGRNLSTETSSTIGEQRRLNYALQPMSKDEFIKLMTTDLPAAPAYFSRDAEINRSGAASLTGLPPAEALTVTEVCKHQEQGSVILDVREASQFGAGHIPGSLNIGLSGQFASWAGSLIPIASPVVIVADSDEKVAEAQLRLARVGLENVRGYLSGGTKAWEEARLALALVPQINVAELRELIATRADLQVIDVRRAAEFESGHAPRAASAPLGNLRDVLPHLNLKPNAQTAVICAGGYRSSAATSILQQLGFKDLLNVAGGTRAWIEAGYEVEMPA